MKDLKPFENRGLLKRTLEIMEKEYCPYAPDWHLYQLILTFNKDKYSDEFIGLVYATLWTWNMNSRRAKLNEFELFKETIMEHKNIMKKLTNKKIEGFETNNVEYILSQLFSDLKLVYKEKPILVTLSFLY
jgi:hypothetical protein